MSLTSPAVGRRVVALLLAFTLALPRAAYAHVRLDASTPAGAAVITTPPPRLQLRFTAHIEQRYTQLELSGPDERLVPLGTITFVNGSDREFYADVPPLAVSGTYTVRWRTAGADGHPLEGSFTFTLDLPGDAMPDPMAGDTPAAHRGHVMHDVAPGPSAGPLHVLGRGLHFGTLIVLLGALACRVLLAPRLQLNASVALELRRRIWRVASLAAFGLVVAAVFRLWLQSVSLHGAERAWHVPLLTLMLTGTSWGRVWVVQACLLGLFAAGLVAARPARDRIALVITLPAALGLAAVPALSGHAAGAGRATVLAVLNDTLHVAAAGTWLGMLSVMMFAALPALARSGDAPDRAIADMVQRFSPLALTAAGLLVLSGLVNSLLHFDALAQLVLTGYGRALLLKLALFAGVLAAGAYNWRRLRPRLGAHGTAAWLRRSIALELVFALTVIAATAYLTGLSRPG